MTLIMAQQQPRTLATPETISKELFDRYMQFLAGKSEGTKSTYTRQTRPFLQYIHDHGIQRPTREDIISFSNELKAQGLKASTRRGYLGATRLFLQWCTVELGDPYYNTLFLGVQMPKLDKEFARDYMTPAQVVDVLEATEGEDAHSARDYAIIMLAVCTGLRTVEITRADVGDLGKAGRNVKLRVWGKGREAKDNFVIVPADADAAIRKYLATRPNRKPDEPLFVSVSNRNNGGRMTTRSVGRIIKSAMLRANLDSERMTPHSTRHTFVTLSIEGGETVQNAQMAARHDRIDTTMRYAHMLDKENNTCSRTVQSAIRSATADRITTQSTGRA